MSLVSVEIETINSYLVHIIEQNREINNFEKEELVDN
jgi:hypothetical protein